MWGNVPYQPQNPINDDALISHALTSSKVCWSIVITLYESIAKHELRCQVSLSRGGMYSLERVACSH